MINLKENTKMKKGKLQQTEKQINYRKLVEKYRLFQELMDMIPDVVYFKDKNGRLILVNQAHAKGLGLRPEQVVGKTDFDIFPKARAKKMFEDDMKVIKSGKPIVDKVERATRADGIDNYVSTTKIPRYDQKGKIIGVIGITRDITRRMQLERLRRDKDNIERKIEALEHLNKTKSGIISVVSHELRTPLAIVKESLRLIYDEIPGSVNDKQKEILIGAEKNLDRLRNIIDELLDVSRIESGRLRLHYTLVNLNDLLNGFLEFFRRRAQERGVELKYKASKEQINIFLDAERINQVVLNLLGNALKFTEQGGSITLELRLLETKARIGVIDTGVGIAKQDIERLFNRFVQVSKVPGAERKGVGLGLSIVKDLIEKHGGEVWVESKLGTGSKFYFTLPLLYTTARISRESQEKINALLKKDFSLYLINFSIVKYRDFKKRLKIKPAKFFKTLIRIITEVIEEIRQESKRDQHPQIALSDLKFGECSIVYPNVNEGKVQKLCSVLRERILGELKDEMIEGVFINLGIFYYPAEEGASLKEQHSDRNLQIRKVFIGSEVRRYRRLSYNADIEIMHPQAESESSRIVDISYGGICVISKKPQRIDSELRLKFRVPGTKHFLSPQGRVTWIRKAEDSYFGHSQGFKTGIEFSRVKRKDKEAISKFFKRVSKEITGLPPAK